MSSVKEGRDQMLVDKSQAQGICMSSGGALEGQQSLCANARACVCTCLHTCTRVCVHMHVCMCAHARTFMHTLVYVHACMSASVCLFACMCVCICVHVCGLEGGRCLTQEGHSSPSLSPVPNPCPSYTVSLVFCVNCT